MIADIYISISTGTFDIENIKYEKKWQQLDLDTNFEPQTQGKSSWSQYSNFWRYYFKEV